ncbi:cilia- and flagella-associated protein 43 [Diachasma alloeum]|uniref:cilia- and flagella-associated protein 43 n=1 Tax=Diachasma alloeum TaxID=454923 RepID=UPI0007382679|nr:cilia- and flagella-associated protein 43 [Diachasma alloeum]
MPHAETKWVKFGDIRTIAFMGKETIAMASGLHIIFINLNTKEERVEKFDSKERGEGACCLAGHPVVPMFAISERRANPKVRVYTYPSVNKVSECIYGERNWTGFISSAFAGTDYLLTLTSSPKFKAVVWLWRTGECLNTVDTGVSDEYQTMLCSPTSPPLITQLGRPSGRLKLYELNICSKIVSLTPASLAPSPESRKSEKITSSSWTYDGNLLLSDDLGNVYLTPTDGKRRQQVLQSEETTPHLAGPLVVAFRGGVAVANTSPKILFYRKPPAERVKSGSPWKIIWEIETSSPVLYLSRHPQRDSILLCSIKGEISEVSVGDDDIPRLQIICQQGSGHLFLVSVHPGRFIATVDSFDGFNLFESLTGKLTGRMWLGEYGRALSVLSHPVLPLLAISTDTGRCLILNVAEASDPLVHNCFHLIREPLDAAKFSQSGRVLGVCSTRAGRIFIVRGFEGNIHVWGLLEISEKIADYLIYEDETVLTLVQSNKHVAVGKYIAVYKTTGPDYFELRDVVKLPRVYASLHCGSDFGEIIASPFLSKQLHLIKSEDNFDKFILTEALSSSHRLRDVKINADTRYVVTFGYDGLVVIRNRSNLSQLIAVLTTHHRQEGGVKHAVPCPCNSILVTLGKNGNLVASKISQLESAEVGDHVTSFADAKVVLSNSTGVELDGDGDSTWIELKEIRKLERERNEMAIERASILSDFEKLRDRLKALIDDNEKASEAAKLPLENFDLDKEGRARAIENNREEQKNLVRKLEEKASREAEISEFLRKLCWDSMQVPACALISLDGRVRVDNYALPRISDQEEERRAWAKFYVDLSTKLSSAEAAHGKAIPPTKYPQEREPIEKASEKVLNLLKGDDNDEEEKFALSGTTTHRWIREDPSRVVNQILRDGSHCEGVKRNILGKIREEKLKKHFNKLFEAMHSRKSSEIKLARERIARIDHCTLELRQMFQVDCTVDHSWLKLEWQESERPESMVEVEDEEVYRVINDSGSEANVKRLDNSVTREETSVLADTFRTGELKKMMDGVLEVKWEDEIKKDIPRPDCLMKDPSSCSADDLRIIKNYEEALRRLEGEREKYRKCLEKEIEELTESLKSSVTHFNREMELFYLKRLKVESAVLQETLMRLRESQRHHLRLKGMEAFAHLELNELAPAQERTKKLIDDSSALESNVNESRVRYDNLSKRDKLLEGKFRGEFTDLKQPMVDHLLRHYKKRPRLGQLTCTSITYLTEMGKCILSGEKSEILPRECLDYSKGMDMLDVMPSGLPNQIDGCHWMLLCKLRRSKVEIEIRLKSCAVELAEAEQTLTSHQKAIQTSQNRVQQLRETITERKRQNVEAMRDMKVQLVLKMGQIETQLSGNPRDLDNAVLVPFDVVLGINDAIVGAGRKKLGAMKRTMEFRRTIEWREWRHACMKMTLEDMKEDLKILQGVKVTREIQRYLMRHDAVGGVDKDTHITEKSILSKKKQRLSTILDTEKSRLFDIIKTVNQWQKRNDRLEDKIEKVKTENCKMSLLANDEARVRQERFVRAKLKAIMKRNRLVKKIKDNYAELTSLRTQLELLRLKTYPTLRLKDARHLRKN